MRTEGISHGAATIVNAISNGRGVSFGIALETRATVELLPDAEIEVHIEGFPGEDPALVKKCVAAVLERFDLGQKYGAKVVTRSQIPVSKGLKSSSAAANAVIKATLKAIGKEGEMDDLDAIRIGTAAAKEAKVSITGAFDDACACYFGGICLTDNRSDVLIARDSMPDDIKVLVHVPDFNIRKTAVPVKRLRGFSGLSDLAFQLALDGKYFEAMTLNGLCCSAALGVDQTVAVRAMENGALGAGLSGTGPSTAVLVHKDHLDDLLSSMQGFEFIIVDVYNGED